MNHLFESVTEGLAGAGYAIVDRFALPLEVANILKLDEFRQGLLHFRKAGIGNQPSTVIKEDVRGDYIRWIDHHSAAPELKIYFDRLEELITYINRNLFLSLKDYEVHLTIYPAGSYYKRHLDQFKRDDHRRLSVILYLNEAWRATHGGQLRLHLPDGPEDVLPIAGRLVCFRSDRIEHEVLAATRDRLSITGWMLDQLIDLKHL